MYQWFSNTSERAILEAYEAAQAIRNIEIEHFNNQKISAESVNYTENVMSYWQECRNKNLIIIKLRLAEFRLSRLIINISHPNLLEKLKFIDQVIEKYTPKNETINNSKLGIITEPLNIKPSDSSNPIKGQSKPISQKTGAIPRSIGRTINKIKSDFAPQAEENFVKEYRIARNRTKTAVKFLAILIIVPLLTQQLSKKFLVSPILERVRGENVTQVFLNSEMEAEALSELKTFQQRLRFESFIHQTPALDSESVKADIKEKAIELAEEFRGKSRDAISNIFADLISLVSFCIVIGSSKKEIVVVKSFMDEIVYGLSDSAKAFIIILFTDIFVGFHSPHGWEIILEGLAEHLGLPASRSGIFIFIATFPVILDTIFKYWIFRYLSRLSPSALATLKEMDE